MRRGWPESIYELPSLGGNTGTDGFEAVMAQDSDLVWQEVYKGHGDCHVLLLRNDEVVYATWYNGGWRVSKELLETARRRFRVAETGYRSYDGGRWDELSKKTDAFIRRMKEKRAMTDNRYEERSQSTGLRYGIIEVTTKCQLRCPGCYMVRRDALNKGEMTLNNAIRVLDLCRDYCGRELETMDILGGEPLLWPHLKDYIEELLRRGILPWVFTNMLAINTELARWLNDRGVHITGKLNIGDPDDPAQLQLQAEMIGANIKTARKMINAIKIIDDVGYHDPIFRLQNLVRKSNLSLVPAYIRYCRIRYIGVDLELMGSGEPVGPDYFSVAPTSEELASLIRELDRIGKSGELGKGPYPEYPEFRNPINKLLMPHVFGACPFYDKGLYFAVDGHIRSCSNSATVLANVSDLDPVREAWESPLLCRRRTLTQQNVGEPCGSCDRWDKCRGGCRATVEGMGDPLGGYTLCPLPFLREAKKA